MDFDISKIRYLGYLIKKGEIDLDKIEIRSDNFETERFFSEDRRYLGFRPAEDWEGLRLKEGKL